MQLHRDREKFEEAGVNLVVIGQGEPEDAAKFKKSQRVEGLNILTDTERETYKLAGTKRATFSELLGPRVLARGLKTTLKDRVHQGKLMGDPARLGGLLIITPENKIVWEHLSSDASDVPANEDVLEAARAAAAGS